MTVQAQILRLLKRVQQEFGMAVILITHDLGVIAEVADEVVVMYAGRAMEVAPRRDLFRTPSHPYTRGLLESIPRADGNGARLTPIRGTPPSAIAPPAGCPFHPRCTHVIDRCRAEVPALAVVGEAEHHLSACWPSPPTSTFGDEQRLPGLGAERAQSRELRETVADDASRSTGEGGQS